MAIDLDMEPILADIEKRLTALESGGGNADPLVDAWASLTSAIDDAQAGLTREERVAFLNDLAAKLQ